MTPRSLNVYRYIVATRQCVIILHLQETSAQDDAAARFSWTDTGNRRKIGANQGGRVTLKKALAEKRLSGGGTIKNERFAYVNIDNSVVERSGEV